MLSRQNPFGVVRSGVSGPARESLLVVVGRGADGSLHCGLLAVQGEDPALDPARVTIELGVEVLASELDRIGIGRRGESGLHDRL